MSGFNTVAKDARTVKRNQGRIFLHFKIEKDLTTKAGKGMGKKEHR
jgi:hypothetical protein